METIRTAKVKARKRHTCDYCGCEIPKGEKYEVQTNVCDGRVYTWRAHIHCQDLCDKIWNYVDPYEGMSDSEFCDAVQDLMSTFYCPFHCDEYEDNTQDCDRGFDSDVCVKRFAKFMENREMQLIRDPNRGLCWRIKEVEASDET